MTTSQSPYPHLHLLHPDSLLLFRFSTKIRFQRQLPSWIHPPNSSLRRISHKAHRFKLNYRSPFPFILLIYEGTHTFVDLIFFSYADSTKAVVSITLRLHRSFIHCRVQQKLLMENYLSIPRFENQVGYSSIHVDSIFILTTSIVTHFCDSQLEHPNLLILPSTDQFHSRLNSIRISSIDDNYLPSF